MGKKILNVGDLRRKSQIGVRTITGVAEVVIEMRFGKRHIVRMVHNAEDARDPGGGWAEGVVSGIAPGPWLVPGRSRRGEGVRPFSGPGGRLRPGGGGHVLLPGLSHPPLRILGSSFDSPWISR